MKQVVLLVGIFFAIGTLFIPVLVKADDKSYKILLDYNAELSAYHLRNRVIDTRGPIKYLEVNDKNPPIVNELLAIEGVMSVNLFKYTIQVEKDYAFKWYEIIPRVTETIGKHYSQGKEIEVRNLIKSEQEKASRTAAFFF